MAYGTVPTMTSTSDLDASDINQFFANLESLRGFNSHYVQVEISDDIEIADRTITTITWDVIRRQRGSIFSVGAPTRFTAPITGYYAFALEVEWHDATGGERTISLVHSNGSVDYPLTSQGSAQGGGNQNGFEIIRLAATEYCTATVYQAENAPVKIRGANRDRTAMTVWMMGVE